MSLEALIWRLSGPYNLALVIKSYLKQKKTSNNVFYKILFSYCYRGPREKLFYGKNFLQANFIIPAFCYFQLKCRFAIEWFWKGSEAQEKWPFTNFALNIVYHQKSLYYHHKKPMIKIFAWSRPVISPIWLLLNTDRGKWTVTVVLCA